MTYNETIHHEPKYPTPPPKPGPRIELVSPEPNTTRLYAGQLHNALKQLKHTRYNPKLPILKTVLLEPANDTLTLTLTDMTVWTRTRVHCAYPLSLEPSCPDYKTLTELTETFEPNTVLSLVTQQHATLALCWKNGTFYFYSPNPTEFPRFPEPAPDTPRATIWLPTPKREYRPKEVPNEPIPLSKLVKDAPDTRIEPDALLTLLHDAKRARGLTLTITPHAIYWRVQNNERACKTR